MSGDQTAMGAGRITVNHTSIVPLGALTNLNVSGGFITPGVVFAIIRYVAGY